jgi:hypothetical protein
MSAMTKQDIPAKTLTVSVDKLVSQARSIAAVRANAAPASDSSSKTTRLRFSESLKLAAVNPWLAYSSPTAWDSAADFLAMLAANYERRQRLFPNGVPVR